MMRSSRADVRNPILSLPAARRIRDLDPETRSVLADLLRDLGVDANARAETSWRKGKGPMAAYWKAAGVYARHIARALRTSARVDIDGPRPSPEPSDAMNRRHPSTCDCDWCESRFDEETDR